MSTTNLAPAPAPAARLADGIAALLPHRTGTPWTVEPYAAWWSTRPATRLVQGERALVVVEHPWRTDVAWQLPGREPYEPDLRLDRLAPASVAREVLRLVLPALDDEVAARSRSGAPTGEARLALLNEIGGAVRAHGVATYNRVGVLRNSSTLSWGTPAGMRYTVTLHGMNPVCDVTITGPVRAVERAVEHFLPEPADRAPRRPLKGVRGRLPRRLAAHLVRFTSVEQLDEGGLSFGGSRGPYGYAGSAADPAARVRDTTAASVDLHGVGVDLMVSLAPQLCR